MQTINLSQEFATMVRAHTVECIWSFRVRDGKVTQTQKVSALETNSSAIGYLISEVDGVLHNHLDDTVFSEKDKEFMLPGLIYIVITPTQVVALYNSEDITCNLY